MKITTIVFVLLAVLMPTSTTYADEEASSTTIPEESGTVPPPSDCDPGSGECLNPDVTVGEEDPNCPSREYVIRCAGIHLDTNQNGKLERSELLAAIDRLPWYGRGIIKILGSVDKMMAKCDIDGDDAIGMDYDMSNNGHQCLATCFKRRAFKNAFFPECQ